MLSALLAGFSQATNADPQASDPGLQTQPTQEQLQPTVTDSAIPDTQPDSNQDDKSAGPAAAVSARPRATASGSAVRELDAVQVFGKGVTRQVSGITSVDIAKAPAGSSPLKALSKLPGVNFNSSDPFGNYEWGSRISLRGFNQNQLGFTLDDVPLGDMSYRNFNGLHISRAITSENLGRVLLSQGTGALSTPSTSNLGGTIQFYSLDPTDDFGVQVRQSFGEYSILRTYARLDSGYLGDSRTKFSISAVGHGQDKWKGPGEQNFVQLNSKLVTEFDQGRFSLFMNWTERKEFDYMDLSKDSVRRLGYNWDYYSPNFQQALDSAAGIWRKGETSEDDAYFAGSGMRDDKLTAGTLDYRFNDLVSIKTTAYHHDNDGTGTWWLPNPPVVNGVPKLAIAERTLEFDIKRSGIVSAINLDFHQHKINAGLWYESNAFDHAMRFYSQDQGATSVYRRPSNPYYTRWHYDFQTDTLQFHVQDTVSITDQLVANFGFKSPHTETSVKNYADTDPNYALQGSLTAERSFLPQGGINFKLNEHNEFFADAAQNIRAFRGVIKGGASPFDTNQAGFDAVKDTIKPEESLTEEIGWRYRDKALETSLTGYHVEFRNRLLALGQDSAIKGFSSLLANVGRVETFGVEGFLGWSPLPNLRWTTSASFNDSRYQDDFSSDGKTYNSANKQVVDAPRWIASSQVSYDDGSAFGYVGVNFIDKRYYTYVNDNSIPGYTLWDLGAGYRWHGLGVIRELSASFAVTNLFNREFFVLGDNPIPASDPNGTSYNLLAGTPRTAVFTLAAKF